jgi:DNA polymerase I
MARIHVIDSFAQVFRTFYAFERNPLRNSEGELTSIVFGYGLALLRLIEEHNVTHLVIATDLPGKNFRHDLYEDYKGNRKAPPEELIEQLPMFHKFLELTGIPVIGAENYEADDVIGSISEQFSAQGHEVVICSRDKDLMQLINPNVTMIYNDSKKGDIVTDIAAVKEKFNLPPEQIRDLLAIMGDTADNVPGVAKVGPKGAALLLQEFGTLENIYKNIDNIAKKGLRTNLENAKEMAFLSQKLVSINCKIELNTSVEDLVFKGFENPDLESFLKEKEVNGVLRRILNLKKNFKDTSQQLLEEETPTLAAPQIEYILADTPEILQTVSKEIMFAKVIAIDIKTTGESPLQSQIAGISISLHTEKGYYIPLSHLDSKCVSSEDAIATLNKLFDNEKKVAVFHEAKFDLHFLNRIGIYPKCKIADSQIAAYLLSPGARDLSLEKQALKRFSHNTYTLSDLIGKGKKQVSFDQTKSKDALPYAAENAVFTLKLWKELESQLKARELDKIFWEREIPLMITLLEMEKNGICINPTALKQQNILIKERIAQLVDLIYQDAGCEFNISSPKQLGEILFDRMGLTGGKKTKTGWSTDASVLEKLKKEHPIAKRIGEYRELEKLKNTYLGVLPELIDPTSGRLHTTYTQTVAATGRLSSTNPNLQNIPVRTEQGKKIRSAFVSKNDDYVLLAVDYSQIELRVLAHLSGDENLIASYKEGIDIHTSTAALLFGVTPDRVISEMRRQAKAVNFGVLYGMSAFRLANELEISRGQAKDFIDGYFNAYPSVTEFLDKTLEQARDSEEVTTLFGHKRPLASINASNGLVRQGAERIALNTPIQGTAAELIKFAMIEMHNTLKNDCKLDLKMLLQVHDELIFEVRKDDLEAATKLVRDIMESVAELKVPLVADAGSGADWLTAH